MKAYEIRKLKRVAKGLCWYRFSVYEHEYVCRAIEFTLFPEKKSAYNAFMSLSESNKRNLDMERTIDRKVLKAFIGAGVVTKKERRDIADSWNKGGKEIMIQELELLGIHTYHGF